MTGPSQADDSEKITIALRIPAQELDDVVQLLAEDPELLDAARRYRGWLLSNAPEKKLISRADSLAAEISMDTLCGITPPPRKPAQGFSDLILTIPPEFVDCPEFRSIYVGYQGSFFNPFH